MPRIRSSAPDTLCPVCHGTGTEHKYGHPVPCSKCKAKVQEGKTQIRIFEDTITCGQCFKWAFEEIRKNRRGVLKHGQITHPFTGKKYFHAWIEDGRVVKDWQTMKAGLSKYAGKGWPKDVFDKTFDPKQVKTYSQGEALVKGLKKKQFGPWSEDFDTTGPAKTRKKMSAYVHTQVHGDERVKPHQGTQRDARKDFTNKFGNHPAHKKLHDKLYKKHDAMKTSSELDQKRSDATLRGEDYDPLKLGYMLTPKEKEQRKQAVKADKLRKGLTRTKVNESAELRKKLKGLEAHHLRSLNTDNSYATSGRMRDVKNAIYDTKEKLRKKK